MKNINSISCFIFALIVVAVPTVVSKDSILISSSILIAFSFLCKTIEDKK